MKSVLKAKGAFDRQKLLTLLAELEALRLRAQQKRKPQQPAS